MSTARPGLEPAGPLAFRAKCSTTELPCYSYISSYIIYLHILQFDSIGGIENVVVRFRGLAHVKQHGVTPPGRHVSVLCVPGEYVLVNCDRRQSSAADCFSDYGEQCTRVVVIFRKNISSYFSFHHSLNSDMDLKNDHSRQHRHVDLRHSDCGAVALERAQGM